MYQNSQITFEIVDEFTKGVVDDKWLKHSILENKDDYYTLMKIRSDEGLCGYFKCPSKIETSRTSVEQPIFCSQICRVKAFKKITKKPTFSVVDSPVVEHFSEQRPPKKLDRFNPSSIEGIKVFTGPYSSLFEQMSNWISTFPISGFTPRSDIQNILFNICFKYLDEIGITLADNSDNNFHFVNIIVPNNKSWEMFENADENFKRAWSYAMFEIITGSDMGNYANDINFDLNTYTKIVEVFGDLCFLDDE